MRGCGAPTRRGVEWLRVERDGTDEGMSVGCKVREWLWGESVEEPRGARAPPFCEIGAVEAGIPSRDRPTNDADGEWSRSRAQRRCDEVVVVALRGDKTQVHGTRGPPHVRGPRRVVALPPARAPATPRARRAGAFLTRSGSPRARRRRAPAARSRPATMTHVPTAPAVPPADREALQEAPERARQGSD